MPDEFEITATGHPTEPNRTWTRARLSVSTHIADQAVHSLGYARAEVVNTFGGHRSSPLYSVTPDGGVVHPES